MTDRRIYLSRPEITNTELERVRQTLLNGWVASLGPELYAFEAELKRRFHYSNVLALNSGTSALHLAIKLAGIGRGDQVVVGSFTFVAAANVVLYEGGTPVFLDSDRLSWNLDPELLESYLSQVKEKPKAILVTHIFGRPAHIEQIKLICERYKVILIEDAAEAIGSKFNGKYLGSFGDFGVLSFNGNKLVTTGGGGALICQSSERHQKGLFWATQSKEESAFYHHKELGYNYRLSNVLAGLGLAQLERYETLLAKKKALKNAYLEFLKRIDWIELPNAMVGSSSNNWLNVVLIKKEFMPKITPEKVMKVMSKEDIEVRRFWKPLHLQPLFEGTHYSGGEVSEDLFDRGMCLPSGVGLTESELQRIFQCLMSI